MQFSVAIIVIALLAAPGCGYINHDLTELEINSLNYYCTESVAAKIAESPANVKYMRKMSKSFQYENHPDSYALFKQLEKLGCGTASYYAELAGYGYINNDIEEAKGNMIKSVETSKDFSGVATIGMYLELEGYPAMSLLSYMDGLDYLKIKVSNGTLDYSNPLVVIHSNEAAVSRDVFDDGFLLEGICLAREMRETLKFEQFLETIIEIKHPYMQFLQENETIRQYLEKYCVEGEQFEERVGISRYKKEQLAKRINAQENNIHWKYRKKPEQPTHDEIVEAVKKVIESEYGTISEHPSDRHLIKLKPSEINEQSSDSGR